MTPMLSTPPLGGRLFVEPLEQRIAPTNLVALANHPQDAGDAKYLTYSTQPSADHLGFVSPSVYGINGPANVHAIALSGDGVNPGDQIQIFTADGYRPFLQIPKGLMVAFFQDVNGDNEVQTNELVGLSLGKKTQVTVNGNVNGDIVTNLSAAGTITGSVGGAKQKLTSLSVVGNVFGNIISGGDIGVGGTGIAIAGNVNAIYAGTAANGLTYNFEGAGVVTGALSAPTPANNAVGSSISNVSVLSVTDRFQAGDGGLNGAGGNISNITFQGDADGLTVLSGNGGAGTRTAPGGAGGAIEAVLVKGVPDATAHSPILIQSGHGGDNAQGKGGAGGAITGVGTSLDLPVTAAGVSQQSASLLGDNIIVRAGAGGNGLKGGTGGSVGNSLLFGSISDDGVVSAAGVLNPEIQVLGGAGGLNTVAGPGAKSGKGGSLSTITAENLDTLADANASSILLQGGDSGLVQAGGKGKAGGDIGGVSLLGTQLFVVAGNGAAASGVGGAGGNLSDVAVLNLANLLATNITLNAGVGGSSVLNTGGAGGNINNFQVSDSDLAALTINEGTHGNGGIGQGGKGGVGGSVTGVQINDSGSFRALAAVMAVRSGVGGDGILGGAQGGDISGFQFLGSDIAYNLSAGSGGSVLTGGLGKGGAGGSLNTVSVSNQPSSFTNLDFTTGGTGNVTAGNGGNGTSKGGAGGEINLLSLRATADVDVTAGSGGAGTKKFSGAGGAVLGSGVVSLFGSVSVTSGSGAANSGGAGAGGLIDQFTAAAATDVSIIGGAGGSGGAGGDITKSGISFSELTNTAATGNVTVTSGAGSSGNGIAGAGGSIINFNGLVGLSGATAFTAGKGGGGAGEAVSGSGGSIDQVKLTGPAGVGANPVSVTFDAGDAGAGVAKRGSAGGSVTNVTLFNLATSTVVHHLAAGDGANGVKHGGAGGVVNEIHVGLAGEVTADIGLRSGASFGYNQAAGGAGGIFAGLGGTGSKSVGAPGNVTNITATAIASISAGKGATPQLAGTVDAIFLNGLTSSAVDNTGAFTNFDTANIIGSVQAPSVSGANVYKTGDGLIAARNITQNVNIRPEAELTLDASGNLTLVDYQQNNSPVITPV